MQQHVQSSPQQALRRSVSMHKQLCQAALQLSASNSATMYNSATTSNSAHVPKPCLKRRSSMPPLPHKLEALGSPRRASCDSLGSVEDDSISSGSYEVSNGGSLSSRKSVSFADSVGEDLCQVKVFKKEEICQRFLFEEALARRWQRWRNHEDFVASNKFYLGGDDEEDEDFDCYYQAEDGLDYYRVDDFGFDAIYEVDIEEDEEDDEEEEGRLSFKAKEDDDEEEEDDDGDGDDGDHDDDDDDDVDVDVDVDVANSLSATFSSSTVISRAPRNPAWMVVPTFLCPGDLPDFHQRLLTRGGLSLESAEVDSDRCLVSGMIVVAPSESHSNPSPPVKVRFSYDDWSSHDEVIATLVGEEKNGHMRFAFVLDTSRLCAGEALEMFVIVSTPDQQMVDDNSGSRYRFICKNRPKFQPGKSLW